MSSIPVFVNPSARNAKAAIEALREDERFSVREVHPERLPDALRECVKHGAEKVVIAGGDGTLALAASVLDEYSTAIAVLPAGTLNHFVRDHDLPEDPAAAKEVALHGKIKQMQAAYVNDQLFLNTSAVGAYVSYVRIRERVDHWLGYVGASIVAALYTFWQLPDVTVEVEVNGITRRFESPLVFVALDERELQAPKLGVRKPEGRRGLHVLIVKPTSRLRLLRMALRMLTGGVRPWAGEDELKSVFVQQCTITLPTRRPRIAVDGEIKRVSSPLTYRYSTEAFTVLVADDA